MSSWKFIVNIRKFLTIKTFNLSLLSQIPKNNYPRFELHGPDYEHEFLDKIDIFEVITNLNDSQNSHNLKFLHENSGDGNRKF